METPPSRLRHRGNDDSVKIHIPRLRKCITGALKESNSTGSCLGDKFEVKGVYNRVRSKTLKFNNCMCDHLDKCEFNLHVFELNRTILEGCFGQKKVLDTNFPRKINGFDFNCELRSNHIIWCEPKTTPSNRKSTRLHNILQCLSKTMGNNPCIAPTTPAVIPTTFAPPTTRILIFSMALTISLMMGILLTALGMWCCRTKNRQRERGEALRDGSKNYTPPEAVYHRCRAMPDMVVELPHLETPNVLNHDYHVLELVRRNPAPADSAREDMPQVGSDVSYEPVGNPYDELDDSHIKARPLPQPRSQDRVENQKSDESSAEQEISERFLSKSSKCS